MDQNLLQLVNLSKDKNIIFFDGVCNFCNTTVDFIWKRDIDRNLHYASLQSDFAKLFLTEFAENNSRLKTIYFYEEGKIYYKSEAVFRILKHLGKTYRFIGSTLLLLPSFIPNLFYNFIARIRYKVMGRRDTCRIPSPGEEKMFLG